LEDATATSIWGAQAANGVIVITTKKSNFNKKLSIDINTSLTLSPIPDLYALPEMSTEDYLFVEEYLFNKKFKLSDTSSTIHLPLTPVYEMLLQHKYGRISAQDSAAFMDDLKTVDPRKEYKDNFYQPALLQQYNLSMMGGSNNIAWLIAASH